MQGRQSLAGGVGGINGGAHHTAVIDRPKVSHGLLLIRVADDEKKEGLSN
jgi:hypothetical protein